VEFYLGGYSPRICTPPNKLPHTKVQYLPSIREGREPKSRIGGKALVGTVHMYGVFLMFRFYMGDSDTNLKQLDYLF
jgi:hypothetical protein